MGDTRLEPLVLSEDERRRLENWVKRRSTAQGLVLRARIVLACAQGGSNLAVAARLASTVSMVPCDSSAATARTSLLISRSCAISFSYAATSVRWASVRPGSVFHLSAWFWNSARSPA